MGVLNGLSKLNTMNPPWQDLDRVRRKELRVGSDFFPGVPVPWMSKLFIFYFSGAQLLAREVLLLL